MLVAVFLMSVAMVAMGVAAVVFGAPIIQVERGMTMVLAGTIVATGGLLLFGVGVATQHLRRIVREQVRARERATRPEAPPVEPPRRPMVERAAEPAPAQPLLRPTLTEDDVADADTLMPPAPARPPPTVVGRYASGGNSYIMYSDGSIDAETPGGPRRFSSIDELKSFAAGAEVTR